MGPIVNRFTPFLFVATLAIGLAPAAAGAQVATDQRARELYLQGDRYYSEGRYELAVSAFQESYDLSGRPLLLFNLANAYERLGRYAEALDALRRYQPSAPPHEQMALRSRIASLEERAAQAAPDPTPEPAPSPSGDSSLMLAGYAVGGAGLALTVVGIVMGVLALDARGQAQSGCVTLDGADGRTLCDASVQGALEQDATYALVADIGIVTGVAAVAAGAALVVLGVLTGEEPSQAAAIPYVAPRAEGAELGVVVPF